MTGREFEASGGALRARLAVAAVTLLVACAALGAGVSSARQTPPQGAQGGRAAEVAGLKFVVPPDFSLRQISGSDLAFMSNAARDVALFVAVPGRTVDDEYLSGLAENLSRHFLPQEKGFTWKIFEQAVERKVSSSQTRGGTVKGLNAKKFVQVDYVVLEVRGRLVVVGLIATFGDGRAGKFLFDVDGREYSVHGWLGLFHLIASVTGERHEDR